MPGVTESEWPATRWQLTAPESFVLLNGTGSSGSEAFKLGVMELVGRGALSIGTATEGRFRHRQVTLLRDGGHPVAPRERVLEAIWSIYRRTPSDSYGDGQHGAQIEDVARTAVQQYAKLGRFVSAEVVPALVERGLYERKEGRILWIIPTTKYEPTADGHAARAELERLLTLGRERVVDGDSSYALQYASLAGAAVLLQPDLLPQMRRARSDAASSDTGVAATDYDDDDGGGFDFGGFELPDFGGGFDAALDAIDSALDSAFDSVGGDSGGGGGDGGGGDGGGGGGK
jgi:hypothetical protein